MIKRIIKFLTKYKKIHISKILAQQATVDTIHDFPSSDGQTINPKPYLSEGIGSNQREDNFFQQ